MLFEEGRVAEAEPLLREALACYELALGAAHASTRNAAKGLGILLRAKEEVRRAACAA